MRFNYTFGAVLLALVVGGISAAPQFFIKRAIEKNESQFIAAPFIKLEEGAGYFQFARNVAAGNFPPSDLFSGEKVPSIYPWLPPLLLAAPIKLFNGNVSLAYIAANFIFPAILFLFFYVLGFIIFHKNQLWAFFFGLVGILTPAPLSADAMFFSLENFGNILLKDFYPAVNTYLPTLFFSRVDYPLLTYIIYLPAIIALFIFWFKPKISTALLAGFWGGLLFYTYFHKWVYWVVVLTALFLLAVLFFRDDFARIKKFIFLLLAAATTSIPYFINYFRFSNFHGSEDLIKRLAVETGRSINLSVWPSYVVYMILAVLVCLMFYRKDHLKAILYWSFIIAAFIVWNIQVVMGYVPHSDHWPRAINPLLFIVIFDLAFNLAKVIMERWRRLKTIIPAILILLMALLGTKKIVNAVGFLHPSEKVLTQYTLPSNTLDSYEWLDENSSEASVVSNSFITSIYLSGFSSARPFLPWGGVTSISNFDLENLFLKSNKLFNVSKDILEKRLRDGSGLACYRDCASSYVQENIKGARFWMYQLYFLDPLNPEEKSIPDAKVEELLNRYERLKADWPETKSDFVYFGQWEKQFNMADPGQDQGLTLVFYNSFAKIYKITR